MPHIGLQIVESQDQAFLFWQSYLDALLISDAVSIFSSSHRCMKRVTYRLEIERPRASKR